MKYHHFWFLMAAIYTAPYISKSYCMVMALIFTVIGIVFSYLESKS